MSTTVDTGDPESDAWEEIEAERDLLEHIVDTNGPFAPDAKRLLDALDARAAEEAKPEGDE